MAVQQVTNCTKLRDFQYRLLHKKVPTNKELCKWKILTRSQCERCKQEDDIKHTLYTCQRIQNLWESFAMWITQYFEGEVFVINFTEVVLNWIHIKPMHLANLFCLISKQLIYRTKCKRSNINFNMFIREVELIERIELEIAYSTKKTNKHYNKWYAFARNRKETTNDYAIHNFIDKMKI